MKKILQIVMILFFVTTCGFAQKITVFAASDLRFALDEIKVEFLKIYPEVDIEMIYGSSGKGMHQIENGAPYDIFFSANEAFVKKLYKQGVVVDAPKLYAIGRIVLWSTHKKFDSHKGFANLQEPWVRKISIANPSHAPYGEKAKQALESVVLYTKLESKIVMGENISHAVQFIQSQAADIGIIALSLALAPTISQSKHSAYYLIDNHLHEPLKQAYGLTKKGSKKSLALQFYAYIESQEAQSILQKHGFETDE